MKTLELKETGQIWDAIRAQFDLTPDYIHLGASQFISSHPKPVQEAIERYRQSLNANPVAFVLNHENQYSQSVRIAAARYLQMDNPDHIALTDSTTMGLGLIYTGLMLERGDEILSTQYDHYSHQEAIRLAAKRAGATHRIISLYQDLKSATQEEMLDSIEREVTDATRVIGLTWVHSSTGLKVPMSKIAQVVKRMNQHRDESRKILLIVDGVHGFGIETDSFEELGCDFFIAGCHKWLYGPRGTGIVAGTSEAWQRVLPVIPTFTYVMDAVTMGFDRPRRMDGTQMTPGGFHSLEHRWALKDAFHFVESIGKERIRDRVHQLNKQAREGLAALPHVTVHTPMNEALTSGIAAFEVKGYTTEQVVNRLMAKRIVSTSSPYKVSYARFTPGIYSCPEDVERGIQAIKSLN